MPNDLISVWLRKQTPPLATAPIASSSWPGTPSLRARNTSSGAPNFPATSKATGTPPRGSPSTIKSARAAYCSNFPARSRPLPRGFGIESSCNSSA